MSKMRTRHPAEFKGPLKEINRLFIKRLMRFRPESYGLKDFLDFIFHYKTRDIETYVVTKAFAVRGDYLERPENRVEGYVGFREVKKGALVIVREDMTLPNMFEMEIFLGQGGKDTVFRLNYDEWSWTRERISLVTEMKLLNGKSKTTMGIGFSS